MKLKKAISKILMATTLAATLIASPLVALAAGSASLSVGADNAAPKAGDTVKVTISASGDTIASLQGAVSASEGLEFVDMTASTMVEGGANGFATAASSAVGTVSVVYTYKVAETVEAGTALTVTVSNVEAYDGASGDAVAIDSTASATMTVAAVAEPTPDDPTPSDPTPSDPTPSDPTPSNPQPSNPSTPSNPSNDKGLDDVPKTGDASSNMMVYAVVAIAAAGAIAVVSAKKLAR